MTPVQAVLWNLPEPEDPPQRRRARRWVPRCEEHGCGRRVWAEASLHACADGRRRGDKCRRAYLRAHRRLRPPRGIRPRPPGHIPGQTAIPLPDQEQP